MGVDADRAIVDEVPGNVAHGRELEHCDARHAALLVLAGVVHPIGQLPANLLFPHPVARCGELAANLVAISVDHAKVVSDADGEVAMTAWAYAEVPIGRTNLAAHVDDVGVLAGTHVDDAYLLGEDAAVRPDAILLRSLPLEPLRDFEMVLGALRAFVDHAADDAAGVASLKRPVPVHVEWRLLDRAFRALEVGVEPVGSDGDGLVPGVIACGAFGGDTDARGTDHGEDVRAIGRLGQARDEPALPPDLQQSRGLVLPVIRDEVRAFLDRKVPHIRATSEFSITRQRGNLRKEAPR